MSEVPFAAFLAVVIVFTLLDKGLTYGSLYELNKTHNYNETLSAERNPLAKWTFNKFGLIGGSMVMGLFSVFWMILLWFIGSWIFGPSSQSKVLYVILIASAVVVANNIFYYMRFRGIY
jgi:hypothetical protein